MKNERTIQVAKNTPDETSDFQLFDFSVILKSYGLTYKPSEFYWQVGEIQKTQGWILHLSVIEPQAIQLFHIVIPELIRAELPFKIIRDDYAASLLMDASYGYRFVGKMMAIYPADDQQALFWAKMLIELTAGFRGPAIPTDRHLGAIVYTRYGSFQPVMVTGVDGVKIQCIYDKIGQLVPDPYHIPFQHPEHVSWPFREISSAKSPSPPMLLNYSYYPLYVIKADGKGDVIRALYFKKFWQIKACIIKQGRMNMFVDSSSRDIQQRLQWQHELYQQLGAKIPLPRIFDFFRQGDDMYLAMEYIKGVSMTQWIKNILQFRHWLDVPLDKRTTLLDMYVRILEVIGVLHDSGYIHRDITPENFLIDRKKRMFLIDMELAWCSHSEQPNPPFKLGTPGFMSREQFMTLQPGIHEDIYALGSLLMVLVTNLTPMRFHSSSSQRLKEQIAFFTGSNEIGELVAACRHADPSKRPGLEHIRLLISNYRQLLQTHPSNSPFHIPEGFRDTVNGTICKAIPGLVHFRLRTQRLLWVSQVQKKENLVVGENTEGALYFGWHTGMAGPLWVLALARQAGYEINACLDAYEANWKYIQRHYYTASETIPQSLYAGGAGIALALIEAKTAGLLPQENDITRSLRQCFSSSTLQADLSAGWAGEGLALMYCIIREQDEHLESLLTNCVKQLLQSQKTDGSWNLTAPLRKKGDIVTGLDRGVAGIAWFLMAYWEIHHEASAGLAAQKALDWLVRLARKKNGMYTWPLSSKSSETDAWDCGQGIPGIILALIKGYELFKVPVYRQMAENYLQYMHARPIYPDFTLGSGLAGLGELYLEGFRVFGDKAWKERADWIASILVNCFQEYDPGEGYWLTYTNNLHTVDLFSGNSGLLHFLLRYINLSSMRHPLSPSGKQNFKL